MAAKNKPPQSVLVWHTKMVKELDELFPVEQNPWIKTRYQVQMAGLLPAADLGEVTNMFVLFIKLMEKDKIKYGKYKLICEILKPYNAAAGKIIEYYTGLINEAFSKTGKRKYSSNSDSGLEDEGDWRNRRDVVPSLEIKKKFYSVTEGDTVLLKCAIPSTTRVRHVQWKRKRKGEATFSNIKIDNNKYFGGVVSSPTLSIDKTKQKDNGAKYVCHATNDAGTGHSDEIHVTVTEPERDAAGAGKMTFREMLENAMKEAEDQISVFVRSLGEIQDFKITSDRDTRQITVQVTVQNDIRGYEECLQKQIQSALGFKQRIFNLQIVIGCVIVSFDITGATHPWQASALALADKFSTGLNKGSIRLTDETGKPLQIQRDSIKITLKGTDDAAVDVNLPIVSIDQAAYCGVIGDIAILKSRLITSTHITSVRWFRINNDNGTEHAIVIDNKKYFGGAIESPSLVIDDTTVEDAGRYVCHADNRFGVGKSFATSLYIFNSDDIETVFAALQAETSLKDSQSEGSFETKSDDDSMTHTLTENESTVPFQGLAAEDNPPSEVLKIPSKTMEELGKRKHTHDFDSETEAKEGNSKRRKRKRKTSRDSNSETENEGRESPQRKDNPKTSLALQAKTLPTASDDRSMAQQVPENMSPVSRFDMAKGFIIPQEVLDLHTDMVRKLGELFPVNGKNWQNIKNEVQMRGLLPVADAEDLKTMYNLFMSLVQKKDNDITYGEYTRIRTILRSCDTFAGKIIDHYTGLIHEFYKDVPTVEINTESYSVKKGHTVVLKCELIKSNTAIVDVQWKRKAKGKDTFTDIDIDGERYVGGSVQSPSLCITETREEDNEATYICQVKNAAGTGQSDEIRVKITQPEQETDNLETLLALQPETSQRDSQESLTLLDAIDNGDIVGLIQALDKGGGINIPFGKYRATPIHFASKKHNLEIVEELFKRGANINAKNVIDDRPLHEAVRFGKQSILSFLLEKNANPNVANKYGDCPLMYCFDTTRYRINGWTKKAKVLLKHGANKGMRNHHGKTAVDHLNSILQRIRNGTSIENEIRNSEELAEVYHLYDVLTECPGKGEERLLDVIQSLQKNQDEHPEHTLTCHGQSFKELCESALSLLRTRDWTVAWERLNDVPGEIHQLGTITEDMFLRSLETKQVQTKYIRLMIVGDVGVGKTTLCLNLIDENETACPTDGINVFIQNYLVDIKTGKWRKLSNDDIHNLPTKLLSTVCRAETTTGNRNITETTTGNRNIAEATSDEGIRTANVCTRVSNDPQEQKSDGSSPTVKRRQLDSEKMRNALKGVNISGVIEDDDAFLSVWDFAGDEVYEATHHIFMSPDAVYIIVFNSAACLAEESNLDKLYTWQEVIRTYSTSSAEKEASNKTPPIILVGTHLDKIGSSEDETSTNKTKLLQKMGRVCGNSKLFFVDNTNKQHPAIQRIRNEIVTSAPHQKNWNKPIPATWVTLDQDLRMMKQQKRYIIQLSDVFELDQMNEVSIGDPEEIKNCLRYMHLAGTILFFEYEMKSVVDKEPLIVTHPQWIVDAFRCIIKAVRFVETHDDDSTMLHIIQFQKSGILTLGLLERLWTRYHNHQEILTEIMQHLDLLAVVSETGEEPRWIVPSMLRDREAALFQEVLSNPFAVLSKTLCFVFKSKVMFAIYDKLLARCLSSKLKIGKNAKGEPLVRRASACLELSRACNLLLSCEGAVVSVTLVNKTKDKDFKGKGTFVRNLLCDILNDTLARFHHTNLTYELCLHCTHKVCNDGCPVPILDITTDGQVPCCENATEEQHWLYRTDTEPWMGPQKSNEESEEENAGNFRKEHDDTHDARTVSTWQTAMNAVGFIQGPVFSGTGFRVGKDKIMTAYHVVEDITKTHKGAKPDLSNLGQNNVFITFNFIEANDSKNTRKFHFTECLFHDKEMDFAILELRNKDKTEESSYPKAITHFKPVYPEQTFALLGHPDRKPMQLDPKVHIFDPESDQGKRRLEEMKQWGRKQGKESAYENILDKNKVLFDCWVQHGASGSPGIEMGSDGEPVCSLMLIHGYPDFVFDEGYERKEEDHPYMIEEGVTMKAIAETLFRMGPKAKAIKLEIFADNSF